MSFAYVAVAAIAISVIGAGVAAYSSYQQGQAMAKQSAYNALVAQRNAALPPKNQK